MGGAPAAIRERRPASLMTSTATITAPIVQGHLQPARGGAWLLVAQCHCVAAARPHPVIVTPEGAE